MNHLRTLTTMSERLPGSLCIAGMWMCSRSTCSVLQWMGLLRSWMKAWWSHTDETHYRPPSGMHAKPSPVFTWHHGSFNTIIKFADDTTVISLISSDDETVFEEEVRCLTSWLWTTESKGENDKPPTPSMGLWSGSGSTRTWPGLITPSQRQRDNGSSVHNWDYLDWLHHRPAWQLHCPQWTWSRPKTTARRKGTVR